MVVFPIMHIVSSVTSCDDQKLVIKYWIYRLDIGVLCCKFQLDDSRKYKKLWYTVKVRKHYILYLSSKEILNG